MAQMAGGKAREMGLTSTMQTSGSKGAMVCKRTAAMAIEESRSSAEDVACPWRGISLRSTFVTLAVVRSQPCQALGILVHITTDRPESCRRGLRLERQILCNWSGDPCNGIMHHIASILHSFD
jgi:hypothetical protein